MTPKDSSDKSIDQCPFFTRRDFINTSFLGTAGVMLGGATALASIGCAEDPSVDPLIKDSWNGYGATGDYADASGNTRKVMEAAHKVRDGLYDADISIEDTGEIYDMVIVGGGMSGLGAAHYFKKNATADQKCLILENHPIFGGEAKRNEFVVNGIRLIGPQGSNDFGVPRKGSGSMTDVLFDELKIPREFEFQKWDENLKPLKFGLDNYAHMTGIAESAVDVGYYFNENETKKSHWVNNMWRQDLENAPYSEDTKADLLKWRYYNNAERSEEYLRKLDGMSYKDYLEKELNLSPEATKQAEPIIGLINGASPTAVSAFAAAQVGMPATGRSRGKNATSPLSFPGGNSAFARYFIKDLIPDSIGGNNSFNDVINQQVNFDVLDKEENKVRMRLGATVVRVEHMGNMEGADYVQITYEKEGKPYTVKARSVVMASGGWINKHVLRDLPATIKEAYGEFNYAPAMIANVALTNWRFMYDKGITAAQWFNEGFGFSCNIRKTMVIGDYNPPLHPDKPVILTFYMGCYSSGLPLKEQTVNARYKIFGTTFEEYEKQLIDQMTEQFGESGFNAEKDIAGITLNRWGHARLAQQPGFYYGKEGKPSPREVVEKGYGRIAIGHSELNGHQNWTGGISQGYRAAEQALSLIKKRIL